MKLYLLQHGDSLPEELDPERPLSPQGREDVKRLADFIGNAGIRVARVLHSGKTRARQSAGIIGQNMAPGSELEATAGLNPSDPVEPFAEQIGNWSQDTLLVGHMPFMGRLSGLLLCGNKDLPLVAFQPGTLACLERDDQGGWSLAWMLRPELFRV